MSLIFVSKMCSESFHSGGLSPQWSHDWHDHDQRFDRCFSIPRVLSQHEDYRPKLPDSFGLGRLHIRAAPLAQGARPPRGVWSCPQWLWVMSSAILLWCLPRLGGAGGDTLKVALYPEEATQVSRLLLITVSFFQCRVRRDVSRPAPHCTSGWKEQFVLFRIGPEWKYIRKHVGMCSVQRRSNGGSCSMGSRW